MAASGYSPISLYYSTTASATPTNTNLVNGELALNITDGKLFYKDNAGTVQTLATKAATSGSFSTTTISTSETLSYGTANGVAYLNGSKVVTTGSALTFDGTVLNASAGTPIIKATASTVGALYGLEFNGGALDAFVKAQPNNSELRIASGRSAGWGGFTSFYIDTAEQMRLTSTGLGIGATSPGVKLDVRGATGNGIRWLETSSGNTTRIQLGTAAGLGYIDADAGSGSIALGFRVGGANLMTLDSSGNLGLGVTPSAWGTAYKSAQVNTAGGFAAKNDGLVLAQNCYFDGTNWVNNRASTYTTRYDMNVAGNGVHAWYTYSGVFGTTGNTIPFTQAMTLDASGNLQLGRTSVIGTNNRLAIQMSGTSASSYTAASNAAFAIDAGTATNSVINLVGGGDMGIFHSNSSNAYDVGISFGDNSNRILSFTTANAERARIDSSGNLLVGKTSTSQSTGGSILYGGGTNGAYFTGVGSQAVYVNRETSDGTVIDIRRAASTVGTISVTTTATAYNTSSDYRLKENIQSMTGALARVQSLKPCTYNWKADGSSGEGFIAHELAEVVPQAVTGQKDAVDADGNPVYQGIDTSFLVATLTAAIQELKAEFDAYKATHP